jgi:hypothetical protein
MLTAEETDVILKLATELSVIERFIRLGRFETMSLHDFLQCVKVSGRDICFAL